MEVSPTDTYLSYFISRPFLWLKSKQRALSFIVMDPFLVEKKYQPKMTAGDLKMLHVKKDSTLIVLAVVNVREEPYTVNLAAPLLIHWEKKTGRQILGHDDQKFPLEPFF